MTDPEKDELVGFVAMVVKRYCGVPAGAAVMVRKSPRFDLVTVRLTNRIGRGLDEEQYHSEFSVSEQTVVAKCYTELCFYIWNMVAVSLAKMKAMEERRNNELAKVPG